MGDTAPVDDWESDYDIFDEGYATDPVPVWRDVSSGGCPVAHTEHWAAPGCRPSTPTCRRWPRWCRNIDRQRNRHIAFGSGIHRCAGSNLARMEMDVALRTWMRRIPEFEVSAPDEVTWAGGQVRGPRYLPVSLAT